ncbi:MAG: zinc-ribbon domain-containing protein [Lachnospiraceae bacterium]|nr:zinc-ribbon domain-containing protein [Lachnospiraceae bacterium]
MDMNFNSDKVYCTKCGTANKAGYRFCVKCGTKLMTPVARSQAEEVQDIPQAEPAKVEPVKAEPTFSAFEQDVPVTEPVKAEPEQPKAEPEPTFSAFEQAAPLAEPVKAEPEQPKAEPEPTFSAFEQAAPLAEPAKVEPEQPKTEPEPIFSAFEAEPNSEYSGFARSGFAGTTTPTAAAGAFATAVEAVKNNKQIDVSDAETVMSLLEQGESSALAKGLPAWDIVPPQVVVRRKHRV